jgi:hypothetical protein
MLDFKEMTKINGTSVKFPTLLQFNLYEIYLICAAHLAKLPNNIFKKIKYKVVPVLNKAPCHEEILGSGGITPSILNLGTGCRCSSSCPSHSPPGKNPKY